MKHFCRSPLSPLSRKSNSNFRKNLITSRTAASSTQFPSTAQFSARLSSIIKFYSARGDEITSDGLTSCESRKSMLMKLTSDGNGSVVEEDFFQFCAVRLDKHSPECILHSIITKGKRKKAIQLPFSTHAPA